MLPPMINSQGNSVYGHPLSQTRIVLEEPDRVPPEFFAQLEHSIQKFLEDLPSSSKCLSVTLCPKKGFMGLQAHVNTGANECSKFTEFERHNWHLNLEKILYEIVHYIKEH